MSINAYFKILIVNLTIKSGLIKNFVESIIYDKPLTIPKNEMLKAMKICLKINEAIS